MLVCALFTVSCFSSHSFVFFFFFNDTATTEIYTLSLHDALPIWSGSRFRPFSSTSTSWPARASSHAATLPPAPEDRKSTRLNSSHPSISYAVFCLKKKKQKKTSDKYKQQKITNNITNNDTQTPLS